MNMLIKHVHGREIEKDLQKLIDEHGEPDVMHYSSCDTYYNGHYVHHSAILMWRTQTKL